MIIKNKKNKDNSFKSLSRNIRGDCKKSKTTGQINNTINNNNLNNNNINNNANNNNNNNRRRVKDRISCCCFMK